jgi:hypothetical protein
MTLQKLLTASVLPLSLAALLLAIPGCCDKGKGDEGYDDTYDYEDSDTEDTESGIITALRDSENDCLFHAEVDGRPTATLRSASVTGSGSLIPNSVTLSKDGGAVGTSTAITAGLGGSDGWTALFTVSGIGATSNGPVGTELDFNGTWDITLTMADGDSCADVPEPLGLELVEED